ncbi:unnamed protein product, partial [Aphanomyces euteiches]
RWRLGIFKFALNNNLEDMWSHRIAFFFAALTSLSLAATPSTTATPTTTVQVPTLSPTPAQTPAPAIPFNGFEDDVDFYGFDLHTTSRSAPKDCYNDCLEATGCKLFVWTNAKNGTCWLKHTAGAKTTLKGAKAAVVRQNAPLCRKQELNLDYPGNDIGNTTRVAPDYCCEDCKNKRGCVIYVWTDFKDGTCWLKSAKGDPVSSFGAVNGRPVLE